GQTVRFTIPKQGNQFINDLHLFAKVDKLQQSGGSYIRFDYCMMLIYDRFRLYYNGKELMTIHVDEMVRHLSQHRNPKQWYKLKDQIKYETNTTTRNTNASAEQNVCIHLGEIL